MPRRTDASQVEWPVAADVWAAALEDERVALLARYERSGDERAKQRALEVAEQLDLVHGKAKRS